MSSNEQPSTLQSVVNSVSGAAQSVLGSVTGSSADKVCTYSFSTIQRHIH